MSTQMVVPNQDQAALTALVSKLASPIVEQAHSLEVETREDYEFVATFMQMLATKKKALMAAFDVKNPATCHPIVLAAYRAKVAAAQAYDEVLKPSAHGLAELEEARKIASDKVLSYDIKAAELKRKGEAEAAAVEKKRLEDVAMEQARQLEAQGESELAQQVVQQAIEAPAPVVILPSERPEVNGTMQARDNYKFEIVNEREAFEYALKHDPEILSLDPVKIGQKTRSQKKLAIGKWPGIRVWNDRKFHGRSS